MSIRACDRKRVSLRSPDGLATGPAAAAANSLTENGNQINEKAGVGIMPVQAPDQHEAIRVRDDGPLVTLRGDELGRDLLRAGVWRSPHDLHLGASMILF
jgi:hypothetical protein